MASISIEPLSVEHAPDLARVSAENAAFTAPFEPRRPEGWDTLAATRARIGELMAQRDRDRAYPFVIVAERQLVGRVNISDVIRGPFQSAHLGYWVAEAMNGQGIGARAIALICSFAFEKAGLHRLQAGTLLHNVASQRVLARNGFRLVGLSRHYLRIAGVWQDHVLFARTVEDEPVDRRGSMPPLDELARILDQA